MVAAAAFPAPVARDRHRVGGRGGFTLVEVLAVVIILGIASAIIVPQLGTRDDLVVASAARTVMADLIYAQNLAISTQQPTYVRFYTDGNGNKYTVNSACATAGDTVVTHPVNKDPYEVEFGSGDARRLNTVRITTANFDGADPDYLGEFTVGFDELGTPRVWCYDNSDWRELAEGGTTSADHGIVLQSGTHSLRIAIERYTGEITTP